MPMTQPESRAVPRGGADRKPLVLCVDDDWAVLAALRRQLRDEPYEIASASSAALALASLRRRVPDVIVSDERMPDTPGSELLADVGGRWPWLGRVILTAFPGREILMRGLESGVDVLIYKPWDGEGLKSVLRRLVEESVEARHRAEARAGDDSPDLGGEAG